MYLFKKPQLETINKGQGKNHDERHDDLQRQTYLNIVNGFVTTGRHHQGIGRCGERRCKTHAGGYGYGHEHGDGTYPLRRGGRKGNGSHEYGCHGVRNEKGEERSGQVNGGQQHIRTIIAHGMNQSGGNEGRCPGFSSAVDMGSMAPKRMMLSQLMVL